MIKNKRYLYLTFVFGLALQSAFAEEIKYQGIKLTVNDTKAGAKIGIERSAAKGSIEVQRIEDPVRLIVDLPGTKIPSNRSFSVTDSKFFTGARFGVHPDKTRIVLDVPPTLTDFPGFKMSGEASKKTTITIGSEAPAKQKKPQPTPIELKKISPKIKPGVVAETPPPTPAATEMPTSEPDRPLAAAPEAETVTTLSPPTPEPTGISTPEPTLAETPTPLPTAKILATPAHTPLVVKETKLKAEQKAKPLAGKVLNSIDFAFLGDQQAPVLKISLGERTEFRLSKTDTKFYTILIPGFTVAGKHLLLPFFPPKDFVGFSVITAKEGPAGLEILIGVDPGVRITAFADGSSILVKVP